MYYCYYHYYYYYYYDGAGEIQLWYREISNKYIYAFMPAGQRDLTSWYVSY